MIDFRRSAAGRYARRGRVLARFFEVRVFAGVVAIGSSDPARNASTVLQQNNQPFG
jgi:hypothetical protein